jgi:hypothetical protein
MQSRSKYTWPRVALSSVCFCASPTKSEVAAEVVGWPWQRVCRPSAFCGMETNSACLCDHEHNCGSPVCVRYSVLPRRRGGGWIREMWYGFLSKHTTQIILQFYSSSSFPPTPHPPHARPFSCYSASASSGSLAVPLCDVSHDLELDLLRHLNARTRCGWRNNKYMAEWRKYWQ